MAESEVSLGEVIRRLDKQEETLDYIRADVGRINGSIAETRILQAKHGAKIEAHDIELRDLKRGKTSSGGGDVIIPINGKTIAALLMTLLTIVGALATAWLNGATRVP